MQHLAFPEWLSFGLKGLVLCSTGSSVLMPQPHCLEDRNKVGI
jgi:hypothetical protein